MNLIEQLGGYECAKAEYSDPMYEDGELYTIKATGTRFFKHNLAEELLEYRRANNIYELGDFFVFLNGDNPEIMEVQHVWDEAVWGGYCGEIPKNKDIRHATDAEIEARKRLEVV